MRLRRRAIVAILCGLAWSGIIRAEEPPKPPSGQVQLASGRVVDYTLHFDRNSLKDSVRLGNTLIALTSAGTLLKFELPEVRLVRERIGTEEVTCLARGEGETILAGLGDGRICRVDPTTLEFTDVAKLPGRPQWVGWGPAVGKRPAGLVVVTKGKEIITVEGVGMMKKEAGRVLVRRPWLRPMTFSVVNDLATGKAFPVKDPSTPLGDDRTDTLNAESTRFLLDRAGRFWLGVDWGEWGGKVKRVDLVEGTIAEIEPPPARKPDRESSWESISGFVELRDGQVWALCGLSDRGEINRIDLARPETLFAFELFHDLFGQFGEPQPKPDSDRPQTSITHVIEEDNSLIVFTEIEAFRVDKELKSWKKFANLRLRDRFGQPDARGVYASAKVVHAPNRVGEPFVLASEWDIGYVLLDETKATSHMLPGEFLTASIDRVENTSEGTLFFENEDRNPPWRYGAKGWETVIFAPPVKIEPGNNTYVLVGPGGAITTVNYTNVSPGTVVTARWINGKSEVIGRESTRLRADDSFFTPDGMLWNVSSEGLQRFQDGRWKVVAELPEGESPAGLEPLNTNGTPWLLLDPRYERLFQLIPAANGARTQFTSVSLKEGEKTLRVTAAISWSAGTVLLATNAGLRTFDPATQKISKVEMEEPPQPVNTFARDGLGRLWIGGEHGLWMVEAGGKSLESFDRVPLIWRSGVASLAPDPLHEDGMIVALGSRGVVFVRTLRKP